MKVIQGLALIVLLCHNIGFSIENSPTYTNIYISLKNNSLSADISFPNDGNECSPMCLNISVQDTQVIKDLQISFNNELIPSQSISNKKHTHFKKTENLNFKVISWIEELEAHEFKCLQHYYLVLLKHSNQVLFWIENEMGIKSCELDRNENNPLHIEIVEARNSLVFKNNSTIQSVLVPIVPTTLKKIEEGEEGQFYFIKELKFVPNIFGFLITVGEASLPLINLYPSDMGPEYGIQINILSSNPTLPYYNIFIAPGDTVTSYNKKRYEIWGKSCIIEHEKGVYNTLCFIDNHAFTYKDKNNQWSVAFYYPIRGYFQLNGKINTIYNALLYGETQTQRSKIRGLCQVEKSEYFYFEVPTCVESKVPFPEQIILGIPEKKEKKESTMPTILLQ